MAKNIEMNYKGESGYEVLYPSVRVANIGDFTSYMNSNYYNRTEANRTFVTNSYLTSNYYNRTQTNSQISSQITNKFNSVIQQDILVSGRETIADNTQSRTGTFSGSFILGSFNTPSFNTGYQGYGVYIHVLSGSGSISADEVTGQMTMSFNVFNIKAVDLDISQNVLQNSTSFTNITMYGYPASSRNSIRDFMFYSYTSKNVGTYELTPNETMIDIITNFSGSRDRARNPSASISNVQFDYAIIGYNFV